MSTAPDMGGTALTDSAIILARCRTAMLRLKLAEASIEEAAGPLRRGWISIPGAIAILRQNDVLHLVLPDLDAERHDEA